MTTYNELHDATHNRLNLRKAQKSIGLIGRKRDVETIDFASLNPGDLPDFKALGLNPVGRVTTDGWTFGREEETTEITSHGFADAGRIDTESVSRTISTTVQEGFRRVVRELTKGADYSNISMTAGGFLVLPEPEMPTHEEWTLVTLFKDMAQEGEIIFGRLFGTIKLQEAGDEAHGGEDAVQQELTWRVFQDQDYGTPVQEFYGGPGFEALATDLGYTLEGAAPGGGGSEG